MQGWLLWRDFAVASQAPPTAKLIGYDSTETPANSAVCISIREQISAMI